MPKYKFTKEDVEAAHRSKKENHEKRILERKVRDEIFDTIKKQLLDERKEGQPNYLLFINKVLKEGIKNPNSRAAQYIADIIFEPNLLAKLDQKKELEDLRAIEQKQFALIKTLYDKQREVVLELHHRKRIMCITSRRCGKTYLASDALVYESLTPRTPCIYINLTFSNAFKQIFNQTLQNAELVGLGISRKSESEGFIEFENGSTIQIGGNATIADAERYRGFKARLVIIDEVGHQRNLSYLTEEILYPLMADFADSTILMIGTPSRMPHHESTKIWEKDDSFKKFSWDMTQNPYIPDAKGFILDICKSKGLDINAPFIQREYFGKFAADEEAVIFAVRGYIEDKKNELPSVIDGIKIGVDFGFSDFNAIVAIAYNIREQKAWTLKEDKFNHAAVSDVMHKIKSVYDECYQISPNVQIFCDTNEESITADLRVRMKLPAYNAYKVDKMYAINIAADMCRGGGLLVHAGGALDSEMSRCIYERDEEDNLLNEIDESYFHPDAIMAMVYALRPIYEEFGYDVPFKLIAPKSDFETDSNGTIIDIRRPDEDDYDII